MIILEIIWVKMTIVPLRIFFLSLFKDVTQAYPYTTITPGLMNGMDTYVSQNVSPHEGTLDQSAGQMTPVTSSAAAYHTATAQSPTVYNTRLLVNGSHPKKIDN